MKLREKEDRYLLKVATVINNSLKCEEIVEIMGRNGYPLERIEEGRGLLELAKRVSLEQRAARADKLGATEEFKEAFRQGDLLFAKLIKLARIALERDVPTLERLGIKGARKRSIGKWLVQAKQFYSIALEKEEVLESLAPSGIDRVSLEEGRLLVERVQTLYLLKVKRNGESQMATKRKERAILELNDWYRAYLRVAKLGLAEVPQLIEKLGIVER